MWIIIVAVVFLSTSSLNKITHKRDRTRYGVGKTKEESVNFMIKTWPSFPDPTSPSPLTSDLWHDAKGNLFLFASVSPSFSLTYIPRHARKRRAPHDGSRRGKTVVNWPIGTFLEVSSERRTSFYQLGGKKCLGRERRVVGHGQLLNW